MLTYLIPTNGFEFLFFAIIFGSAIVIALLVRKNANKDAWEINWQSGTMKDSDNGGGYVPCDHCNGLGGEPGDETVPCKVCNGSGRIFVENADKDDLHPEHGSVFELSDHVMTASEKCAEVLPSTLLVVGLLGTFLGVGMALDDAAGAIASTSASDVSAESMKGLVDNMKGMIEGMGGQFKSSIYGIIASLLFTFWRSKYGSEKERVRWVLTKCNEENEQGDSKYQRFVCQSLGDVANALGNVRRSIGESLEDTIREGYEDSSAALAEMLRNAANPSYEVIDSSRRLVESLSQMKGEMDRIATAIEENLNSTAKAAEDMGKKSREFDKAIVDCVPKLTHASEKMGKGLDKLVDDLIDGMIKKQDGLYKMVQAAEEQKLKAALNVNEVVEGSIKNLAETNAGLTEQLDLLVKNLADIRLDMARVAGRDVSKLPPIEAGVKQPSASQESLEPVVKELQSLATTIRLMEKTNIKCGNDIIAALKDIQVANDKNAKVGLFKRLFGWS